MFVGDCASDADVHNNQALTDYQTDKFIKEGCRANQISLGETYRTLFIKERGNLRNSKANIPLATAEYRRILRQEIDTLQPNVVVPIGELSFNFVSSLTGIRKYRGSVLPTPAGNRIVRCIPVLGPEPYLNENPTLLYISRLDFEKVGRNQDAVGPIQQEGLLWIAKSFEALTNFLQRSVPSAKFLVFDIETYGGIPTCISLCFDGNESVTVPLVDKNVSLDERVGMASLVAQLLHSEIPKVNQNIKYDWRKLVRWGFPVSNVVGDTQIAASVLMPEFPKNLGFLTSIYTDMPYHKDEGKEYDPEHHDRSRLYFYCAKDSLATHKIYTQQQEELDIQGVRPVYSMLMNIYPIYHQMENNGIRIDETVRREKEIKYQVLHEMQMMKLAKLLNVSEFQLTGGAGGLSPDKLRKLIYGELGYTTIRGVKTTEKGLPSTDEESLEILLWKHPHQSIDSREALKTIINVRKLTKVREYIDTEIHPDGRMRSEFNLAGTKTGRTTAGESTDCKLVFEGNKVKIVNYGRSFQTIAKHGFEIDGETYGKDLREMFVPSYGYSFVECDLSQAEARVDAILAKDFDILQVFDSSIGIHRLTGSWVFDCPPEEIKKGILVEGVDRYHLAKTIRHAGERNMGADRLMMMIQRPIQFCTQVLNKFHTSQPNIRKVFHQEIRNALGPHGSRCLIAPNGRRRDFFGRFDEHMVNDGISQLPQAIVTDYLKSGLKKTFETCTYARPLSEAHDGFLAEVPIGREFEYAEHFVRNTQEHPIDFNKCTLARDYKLTIPVEVEWSSSNWKSMEPLK